MAEREDDDVALVALNRFEVLDEGALVHALAGERGAVVCIEGGVRFAAAVEGVEDGLALLDVEGNDAQALARAVDHEAGDEVDDPLRFDLVDALEIGGAIDLDPADLGLRGRASGGGDGGEVALVHGMVGEGDELLEEAAVVPAQADVGDAGAGEDEERFAVEEFA